MTLAKDKPGNPGTEELPLVWYSWVVAVLCLLSYAVSFVSRNVWSTALPVAAPALKLSMTQAGGLMTAFYIGYVAANFFSGFFVDRFGPRKTLAAASFFTGLFTLLIPFASSYVTIFLLRVGAGIAAGPLFSGGVKFQLAWFPQKARATAMGLVMTGPALGGVIANGAFAPLIQAKGWQTGFKIAALVTLTVAVLTFFFAKERGSALGTASKSVRVLTPEEKAADRKALLAVLLKRSFIVGCVAQMVMVGIGQGWTTWIMLYFTKVQGFSLAKAGALLAGTGLVALFTGTSVGIISDLLKARKKPCYIGAVGGFVFTAALLFTTNVALLTTFLVLRIIIGAFLSLINTMQAETVVGPYAGRAMGIYNGICQLGSVIFPVVLGLLLDVSGGNFFIVLMSLATAYLVVGLLVGFGMEETVKVTTKPTAAA
ncbi:putative sulfoacetate transporter SauU [Neomoorella glycerini]|uniref:Putative sulfoacetate transporter SauU n=1 Tax=Neomoorella glycerini TaxID=55779 RepID=A0A6I5ZML7_9FIRM|nr:MFS transporter [Moorella glycerini]QGP91144.1 putative sulfoacetate transporter SauU [Moorella glycerini]